ncbi:hypothetical protein BH11PLA2_BH11PLA2_06510 [soil metagenome]
MPITVSCPGCQGKLNAPDTAAGKRVKCPKCATVMQIPALESEFEVVDDADNGFEVVDETPVKPKAKAAPKRRLMDDDDDDVRPAPKRRLMDDVDEDDDRPRRKRKVADDYDDDEDDDRPRKKKAKKKSNSSSNLPLIICGGVLAIAVVAGIMIFSGSKDKDKDFIPATNSNGAPTGTGGNTSGGWVPFQMGKLRGNCPDGPPTHDAKLYQLFVANAPGVNGKAVAKQAGNYKYRIAYVASNPNQGVPDQAVRINALNLVARSLAGAMNANISDTTVHGFPARAMFGIANGVTLVYRIVLTNDGIYFYGVECRNVTESDANIQRFLSEITLS